MSEQYEWDKTGDATEEMRSLEGIMAHLRYDQPLAAVRKNSHAKRWLAFAMAAAVLLGVGASLWWGRQETTVATTSPATNGCERAKEGSAWSVTALRGAPRCGNESITATASLSIGTAVETDPESSAEILVANIGRVVLEPNSRVALASSSATEHRMQLEYGIMHAQINAPPRLFLVQTPAALAVDLGCAYTLEVTPDDNTHLHVTHGYVSLENDKDTIYVPAGYRSDSFVGIGTTIPYASDAPGSLVEAVRALVHTPHSEAAFATVLRASTEPKDTLGLWHLLSRSDHCEAATRRMQEIAQLPGEAVASCSDSKRSSKWRSVLEPFWRVSG